MVQASADRRILPRSPVDIAIDRVWRFFCSVRAAIFEIIVLALLVLAGTLRGSSVPRQIADTVPGTSSIVRHWYAWDVFHSLPFMVILGLLATAIAICTINRSPGIWRSIAQPTVTTTHGFLRGTDAGASMVSKHPAAATAAELTSQLRAQRYRVLSQTCGTEIHVYADKNRLAKLGTFPFHLALILLLVGGIVSARFGFRDLDFTIPEGSTRSVEHGTDVSVRLDRFSETYREDGTAKEYRSDLVLFDDGKEVKSSSITVNSPVSYNNMTFYQAGFGQSIDLEITGPDGNVLFRDSLPLGIYQSRTNPDSPAGVLALPAVGKTLHVIGPDQNPGNAPEQDVLRLRPGEIYAELRDTRAQTQESPPNARLGQGASATIEEVSVHFVRERRFTVLQIAHNPGIPIFFVAAFLLVGGLAVTFYFPHRRIRAIVASVNDNRSNVVLAPMAKRDWSGQRDFHRLVDALEGGSTIKLQWRQPTPGSHGAAD